ncbi:Zinc metalloproteinase dpy-31 [Bulinus truncatus]|nr:Zinc metalloproteinase dpy-31 [Bulinus truncatus]
MDNISVNIPIGFDVLVTLGFDRGTACRNVQNFRCQRKGTWREDVQYQSKGISTEGGHGCMGVPEVKCRCESIDEQIIQAAASPDKLGFFHLTPSGEMNILTEYDMVFTMEQYQETYQQDDDEGRIKRKAHKNPIKRWPNSTVYYEITESLDSTDDVIIEAVKEWEKFTCLKFVKDKTRSNRILFVNGTVCSSLIGMQSSPQSLILAPYCRQKGIVIHEIGHAIGWMHEQSRPDRDKFVQVNVALASTRLQAQYRKIHYWEDFGVPYDYLSIMHYGGAMGRIVTKDPSYQDKIGQREGMSFKDIKLANLMYRCGDQCPEKRTCPFNGFVLSKSYEGKKECQCWCESLDPNRPLVLCSSIQREAQQPVPQELAPILHDVPCRDSKRNCKDHKSKGDCMLEMESMMELCADTCGFCGKGKNLCMDYDRGCRIVAAFGACDGLGQLMKMLCPASCGHCSEISNPCTILHEMMPSSSPKFAPVQIVLMVWQTMLLLGFPRRSFKFCWSEHKFNVQSDFISNYTSSIPVIATMQWLVYGWPTLLTVSPTVLTFSPTLLTVGPTVLAGSPTLLTVRPAFC